MFDNEGYLLALDDGAAVYVPAHRAEVKGDFLHFYTGERLLGGVRQSRLSWFIHASGQDPRIIMDDLKGE